MEETLTIRQAAQFAGKDEKTIRRWITGKYPRLDRKTDRKGRYLINKSDVEAILREEQEENHTTTVQLDTRRVEALEHRIATLEQEVARHEWQLQALADLLPKRSQSTNEQGRPRIIRENTTIPSPLLPEGYSALTEWCTRHNIAETTARRNLRDEDFKKGNWGNVRTAIDQAGQRHLWEVFHNRTGFQPCPTCPHN